MPNLWFIWSLMLLALWLSIYALLDSRVKRHEMIVVSAWTSLTGLTEPVFVPAYWSPPSLFNLATRTGFDLESLIFAFGIGGIAVVLYELVFPVSHGIMQLSIRRSARHRFHLWAILSTPVLFILLLSVTRTNPIYPASISLMGGGLAACFCRPDLVKKMVVSAFIFLLLYFLYFLTLVAASPSFVTEVWNLRAISGLLVLGVPLEELMFAFSFGFLWSSVYEHFSWRTIARQHHVIRSPDYLR